MSTIPINLIYSGDKFSSNSTKSAPAYFLSLYYAYPVCWIHKLESQSKHYSTALIAGIYESNMEILSLGIQANWVRFILYIYTWNWDIWIYPFAHIIHYMDIAHLLMALLCFFINGYVPIPIKRNIKVVHIF